MDSQPKSKTPVVDNAEHFMYYSIGMKAHDRRIGFVYSDVARQLETELNELKQRFSKEKQDEKGT